mgnify:CR=1 FL=1
MISLTFILDRPGVVLRTVFMWEENTIFFLLIVQLGKRAVSSQLVDALNHAILDALPPIHMGVRMSVISFLLSIMAGIIANYICKWLDERD